MWVVLALANITLVSLGFGTRMTLTSKGCVKELSLSFKDVI